MEYIESKLGDVSIYSAIWTIFALVVLAAPVVIYGPELNTPTIVILVILGLFLARQSGKASALRKVKRYLKDHPVEAKFDPELELNY